MNSFIKLAYDRDSVDAEKIEFIQEFLRELQEPGVVYGDRKTEDFQPFVDALDHFATPSSVSRLVNMVLTKLHPPFSPANLWHDLKPGIGEAIHLVWAAGPFVIAYHRSAGATESMVRILPN